LFLHFSIMLSLLQTYGEKLAEYGWIPDYLIRKGIQYRLGQVLQAEMENTPGKTLEKKIDFIKKLKESPIAIQTQDANEQHYELPTEFFLLILGSHLKYSCCLYRTPNMTLDDAERSMLDLYIERAQIRDGDSILELGCGWGSFSLYVSARFPRCSVTSISNSATQRTYIERVASERHIKNLRIITCDINDFDPKERFDRIISIEMFEHMKNYERLLERIASWLRGDDGKLFVHIFSHREFAYDFKSGDWMADHFFSGGTMPSDDLLLYFQKDLTIVDHWIVDGIHYRLTLEQWLKNMDKRENQKQIISIFEKVYGKQNASRWIMMWRLFFLACSELFVHGDGKQWIVSHYLFEKRRTI